MIDNTLETMRAEAEEQLKPVWADLSDEERDLARQMAVQVANFAVSLSAQVRTICEVTGIGKKIHGRRWDVISERALQVAAVMLASGYKYADAMEAQEKGKLS